MLDVLLAARGIDGLADLLGVHRSTAYRYVCGQPITRALARLLAAECTPEQHALAKRSLAWTTR